MSVVPRRALSLQVENWNNGTMENWNNGTMENLNNGTMESWAPVEPNDLRPGVRGMSVVPRRAPSRQVEPNDLQVLPSPLNTSLNTVRRTVR